VAQPISCSLEQAQRSRNAEHSLIPAGVEAQNEKQALGLASSTGNIDLELQDGSRLWASPTDTGWARVMWLELAKSSPAMGPRPMEVERRTAGPASVDSMGGGMAHGDELSSGGDFQESVPLVH